MSDMLSKSNDKAQLSEIWGVNTYAIHIYVEGLEGKGYSALIADHMVACFYGFW